MSAPKVKYAEVADNGAPAGGTTGQVLKKKSDTDYNTEWGDSSYTLPQATESALGGIKAKPKTTETGEIAIDESTGKLYAPPPDAAANGLPAGGTAGQILVKSSAVNYDAAWKCKNPGTPNIPGLLLEFLWGGREIAYTAARSTVFAVEPTDFDPKRCSKIQAIQVESAYWPNPIAVAVGNPTLTAVSGMGFSYCYQLDGSNDMISLLGSELFPFVDSCVVLWVKYSSQGGAYRKFMGNMNASAVGGTFVVESIGGGAPYGGVEGICHLSDNSWFPCAAANTYSNNAWHMIVFGRDIANRRLYIDIDNGADTNSTQWGSGLIPYSTAAPCVLGSEGQNKAGWGTGYFGPVRFFDHMLDADEIADLWNGGAGI